MTQEQKAKTMKKYMFQDHNLGGDKNPKEVVSTVRSGTIFSISEKEMADINKWKEAIKEVYGEYGTFEYRFRTGSGIGYTVSVYSDLTKTVKDFTDHSNW
jgi:hypothetical protein